MKASASDSLKLKIVLIYNGDGQSSSFNILAVMLFLLEDYHQYGAYINSEDIVEVNGEGPIQRFCSRTYREMNPIAVTSRSHCTWQGNPLRIFPEGPLGFVRC